MKKLLLLFACLPFLASGQISLKIGYEPAWGWAVNSAHTDYFNATHPDLKNRFGKARFIQSMPVGLRFEGDFFSAELGWTGRFAKQEATSEDIAADKELRQRINYRFDGVLLLGIFQWNAVGIGGGLDFGRHSFRGKLPDEKKGSRLLSQTNGGLHFFLSWHPGREENNHFSLRPFVYLPFRSTDISAVNKWLNGPSVGKLETNFRTVGLSLVFFNRLTKRTR